MVPLVIWVNVLFTQSGQSLVSALWFDAAIPHQVGEGTVIGFFAVCSKHAAGCLAFFTVVGNALATVATAWAAFVVIGTAAIFAGSCAGHD